MWRIDRCVFPDATAGDAGGFSNVWCKEADQTHDHTGGLSPDPYLYDTASPIHMYMTLHLRRADPYLYLTCFTDFRRSRTNICEYRTKILRNKTDVCEFHMFTVLKIHVCGGSLSGFLVI